MYTNSIPPVRGTALMTMRKQLFIITLILMVSLLIVQLFIQSFFLREMRKAYMVNVDNSISESVLQLREMARVQANLVEHLAGEMEIRTYASAKETSLRYSLAFNSIMPIIRNSIQNLPVDNVVIYDISNAWYEFSGALPFIDYQWLRSQYSNIVEAKTEPLIIGNQLYLSSASPLYYLEHNHLKRSGLLVSLINYETIRQALPALNTDSDIQTLVFLHNEEIILLSNDRQLEGKLLSDMDFGGQQYYSRRESLFPSLAVTVTIPKEQVFPQELPYIFIFVSLLVFTIVVVGIIIFLSNRWFLRPITQVLKEIKYLSPQGMRLTSTGTPHMDSLVTEVNRLMNRLETANEKNILAQQSLYETKLEKQKTQLHLLKKQINAHFLYNCLTGIKALTNEKKPDLAGEMAEGVALLMRYTHATQEYVNIFDEMSIIQRYIRIMNIRFHNRFTYTFDVEDDIVNYKMLRLLLQPLVENALVHGLEKSERNDCCLHLTGTIQGEDLLFMVEDNGVGMHADKLKEIQEKLVQVVENSYEYWTLKGISLINIQKRVTTAYGLSYGLHVDSEQNRYTCITLRLPALLDDTLEDA